MGTYQAKARGQEEPGDLHQGPRPVANHVFNVVIETVCPCPGGCRESVRTGVGQRVGLGKDLPAPSSPPHRVGETGSGHLGPTGSPLTSQGTSGLPSRDEDPRPNTREGVSQSGLSGPTSAYCITETDSVSSKSSGTTRGPLNRVGHWAGAAYAAQTPGIHNYSHYSRNPGLSQAQLHLL